MKRFKNILYFADGETQSCPALQRAAALASSSQARLTVVDVAEEMLQSARASILAVKPAGFVSPVVG